MSEVRRVPAASSGKPRFRTCPANPIRGIVPYTKQSGAKLYSIAALSIEELETGLRNMDGDDVDLQAFWDKNVASFRQTILVAISDTSESLCATDIPLRWR